MATEAPTVATVEGFLLILPGSSDRIARLLEARGLTGQPGSILDNPLIHLLERMFPGLSFRLSTPLEMPSISFRPQNRLSVGERVKIGGTAAEFVANFQQGRYPQLEVRKRRWGWLTA